jgi:hypothetical protein
VLDVSGAGPVALSNGGSGEGAAFGGPPVLLPAYGGLFGGDPGESATSGSTTPGGDDSPVAQVDQIGQQEGDAGHEADPEAGADHDRADYFDEAQSQQGDQDPPAAVQRGGRAPASDRRTADPPNRCPRPSRSRARTRNPRTP